jgi:hypothetical protein
MSISIHTSISAAVYENENLPQRDERRKALLGVRGLASACCSTSTASKSPPTAPMC